MFDIGFAELLLIGVVGLLVVGPEQLPGAVRTVMAWVNRLRRSFDQIRTEVRRELHNDEIVQKLKAESQVLEQQVRDSTESFDRELQSLGRDDIATRPSPTESEASKENSLDSPADESDVGTQQAETGASGDKRSKPA
ncbi:MAG: twin-arginine translocase subunit TatB [Cellvibrionales bacterium TMED122]|nr:twin-arginine translocase subunit TatB [Halieaceae bacterium]OUV60876.1 MAG: twin-arginine translocase subunit TatB [Cellvibrionales bacterium TMED122]